MEEAVHNDAQQEQNAVEPQKPFTRIPRAQKKLQKYKHVKQKGVEVRKKLAELKKKRWSALTEEQKQVIYQQRKEGEMKKKLAYEQGLEVYIDMDYDVLMEEREIRSLAQQVAHIVGLNKELPVPIKLHLTNFIGKQRTEMEKQGANFWAVHKHENSIEQIVRSNNTTKEFIYLSPDADEDITDIDPEKYIYIVGGMNYFLLTGFVDRTVQKYMSLNKAAALQICALKLPINQYIKKRKRPLNIDTVVCLLSEFHSSKNWEDAYNKATSKNECIVTKFFKQNIEVLGTVEKEDAD